MDYFTFPTHGPFPMHLIEELLLEMELDSYRAQLLGLLQARASDRPKQAQRLFGHELAPPMLE